MEDEKLYSKVEEVIDLGTYIMLGIVASSAIVLMVYNIISSRL